MLSELLRPVAPELAGAFTGVPSPGALNEETAVHCWGGDPRHPAFIDHTARMVMLVGPDATRVAPAVHRLAQALGAPVANTWGAKGIYPWNDAHHMGTCGLQADDFELLGFEQFDFVVAIGIDEAESPLTRLTMAPVIQLRADTQILDELAQRLPVRELVATENELYRRIAAIAQPGYADDSFPRHPARAVMDLKRSLGPTTRVTAQPGLAGLWVARTFPTDRIGSVIVPAFDRPGIGAAVGLASAAQATDTICVVHGPVDDTTAEVMRAAEHHGLPLRLEVWDDDVDWSRTDDLISAAGPVVAWT